MHAPGVWGPGEAQPVPVSSGELLRPGLQGWLEPQREGSVGKSKGGQGMVVFEESNREAENCLDWRVRLESVTQVSGVPQVHLRAIPPVLGGRAGGGWAQRTGSSIEGMLSVFHH